MKLLLLLVASCAITAVPVQNSLHSFRESSGIRASSGDPSTDRILSFTFKPSPFQEGAVLSVETTTKQNMPFLSSCMVTNSTCVIAIPPYLLNEHDGGACIKPATDLDKPCTAVLWTQVNVAEGDLQ